MASIGSHCVLELYECPAGVLDDVSAVVAAIEAAADAANTKLLAISKHRFEPCGVTAVGLLAESHISVHTWPELGYAACDVFTCGEQTLPERACATLTKALEAQHYDMRSSPRGPELGSRPERLPQGTKKSRSTPSSSSPPVGR